MNKNKRRRALLQLAGQGLTLAEIGRRCDPPVSRHYVSMILSGLRTGYRVRPVIARHLGWDPWADQPQSESAA